MIDIIWSNFKMPQKKNILNFFEVLSRILYNYAFFIFMQKNLLIYLQLALYPLKLIDGGKIDFKFHNPTILSFSLYIKTCLNLKFTLGHWYMSYYLVGMLLF